jgi:amino acid permease
VHCNCSDLTNGGQSVTADADGSAGAVSYIDIGKYAYGSRGERAAQLSMYVTNIGIATAYIIFVANTMADAVQGNHVRGELQTLLCYFR